MTTETAATTHDPADTPTDLATRAPSTPVRDRVPSWALFVVVFLGVAATVLVHNRWLFSEPVGAEGDLGLNGLLADQARHFTLWEGNYSRVGFHHPGPALLYVMMVGDVVGHSWLHLVPAATNGMILGQVVFDAALLGAIALVVRRLTGSALGGLFVAALVLMPMAHLGGAADPWPPYQYLPAYALFVVAAIAVASGITPAITAYVVGAGLIAHGQVSFLAFVAATTVVVAAGWWWAHRGAVRDTLGEHRARVRVAAVVLGVFLLPLVLQTVFHDGGPWRAYVDYSTGDGAQHNPMGAAIGWLGWYVTNSGVPISVAALAVVVAIVLALTERDPARRRAAAAVPALAALQAAVLLFYAVRGVDGLTTGNRYLAYFALALTPIVVGLTLVLLGVRLPALLGRVTGPRPARIATAVLAGAVVVALLAWLVPDPRVRSPYRGVPATIVVAEQLDSAPARAGRPVSLRLQPGGAISAFAYTAGVVFELRQRGVDSCVWSSDARQQAQWLVQFTPPYTCDPDDLGGHWQLAVGAGEAAGGTAPADAVYRGRQATIAPLPAGS